MARKAVTLYVDDTSLRLLVTSGQRVKKWADVPLEPGLVENSVVLKPEEFATIIRQILKANEINSKRVILGISGLHCISRPLTLPRLPKDMLEEAVMREAKQALPIPLDELYLAWKQLPVVAKQLQVFLVAIPNKIVDTFVNTLHLAGLQPDSLDIKPMLLARLVKDTTAIILDVQPNEFDIIIKANGIPQPVRTITFPDEKISWQDKLSMIQNEINTTIDFYNSDNTHSPLTTALPVFASGDFTDVAKQIQLLSHKLNRPVTHTTPPFENPYGLNPDRYMANMGLVIKKVSLSNYLLLSLNNLNLLPKMYQPESISLVRVAAVPGLVVSIGLLMLFGLITQNTLADISETRSQLNTTLQLLQQKSNERQQLLNTVGKSEQELKNIEGLRSNIDAALTNLEIQSQKMNGDMAVTLNCLPDTVSLTKVNYADTSFTLTGLATSEEEVLLYVSELNASGRFSRIKIVNMSSTGNQEVRFNVVLNTGT